MITKNLDISMEHISQEDALMLDKHALYDVPITPVVVYKYDEGYFVYVPDGAENFSDTVASAKGAGYSKEFIDVLKLARTNGCKYAQIDCDGETYDGHRIFEW